MFQIYEFFYFFLSQYFIIKIIGISCKKLVDSYEPVSDC